MQSSSESSSSESDSDSDEEYEDGDQKGGAKPTDETDDSDDSDDSDDDDDDYDGDDNEIEIDDRTKGKRKDELFAEEVDTIKGLKHKGECHLQITIQLLSFNWKINSFFFFFLDVLQIKENGKKISWIKMAPMSKYCSPITATQFQF